MSKFTMKNTLNEVMEDQRAVNIIRKNLPFVMNHPRFSEAALYSLEEILNDDMGQVVGIPKKRIKQIFTEIVELDA